MVSNMDVNNNTNISSLIASSISKLTLNTATRAFEQAKKAPDEVEDFKQEDIALIENNSKVNTLDVINGLLTGILNIAQNETHSHSYDSKGKNCVDEDTYRISSITEEA